MALDLGAYGNHARLDNDQNMLLGNHEKRDKYTIQGTQDPKNRCFCAAVCRTLWSCAGYLFLPSMTALRMIVAGTADPGKKRWGCAG
jgi:hypothetical protein